MPRAQTCVLSGKVIEVDAALRLRDADRTVKHDFRCMECGEAVRAHKESSYGAAHFEHMKSNPSCTLSEPA